MDPHLPDDPIGAFYRGELPLFETLRRIFAAIPLAEEEVLAMLPRLEPDPLLADDLARLRDAGWEVHVISAGSGWYIERLFEQVGVTAMPAIHANPGRFEPGGGLQMTRPADARIARKKIGIDKGEVVRMHADGASTIAFAGNSEPDLAAARLVPDAHRYARDSLRGVLDREGLAYTSFDRWHEVVNALLRLS